MAKSFLNTPGLPIGLRNNNPGNIRPGDNWKGMIGTNGGFVVFSDCSWGIRAMAINIITQINNGYNTIEKLIYRWAPPADGNDTEAYVQTVSSYSGIPRTQVLQPNNTTLRKLMAAIMNEELGPSYASMLSDADLNEGLAMVDPGLTVPQAAGAFTIATGLFLVSLYLLATMPKVQKRAA